MGEAERANWSLTLLGSWALRRDDVLVDVAWRQRRLIAALAVLGSRSRHYLDGLLWPDSSMTQASGSLRAAVWRVRHELPLVLAPVHDPLALDPEVRTDLQELHTTVAALHDGEAAASSADIELLRTAELLPGWYEEWVLLEQDHLRLLRLSALERVAECLLRQGDTARALHAAIAATTIAPLHESAQRLLLRSYLASDNQADAVTAYLAFRAGLRRELGLEPSANLTALVWPDHAWPDPAR